MNATLNIPSTARAAQQPVLASALALFANFSARISAIVRAEIEVQRAIDDLATMNERQLRDIGLMRSDIELAVRGSRD